MTLQEAIATKLPYRRPQVDCWFTPGMEGRNFSAIDVMATDWEVQGPYSDAEDEIKAVLKKHGIKINRLNIKRSRRSPKVLYLGGIGTTKDVPTTKHDFDPARRAQRSSLICHCTKCHRQRNGIK